MCLKSFNLRALMYAANFHEGRLVSHNYPRIQLCPIPHPKILPHNILFRGGQGGGQLALSLVTGIKQSRQKEFLEDVGCLKTDFSRDATMVGAERKILNI
jgi:hypothetical protein